MHIRRHFRFFILLITTIAVFTSCKTDLIVLPFYKSTHIGAINKLPAANQVQQKEMMDWYTAHMPQNGELSPFWDRAVRTLFKGSELVEILCRHGAALFFTKANGQLNIYAATWQNKNPKVNFFVGNLIYYSFQDKTVTGVQYNQYGTLIMSKTIKIPKPIEGEAAEAEEGRAIAMMMAPNIWQTLGVGN